MWGSWCEWCCPHERQTRGREEEDFDLDEREDSMVSVAAGLAHNLGCRIWVSLEFGSLVFSKLRVPQLTVTP